MIDLRSDTVTVPTQEMREIMARADVGDDVYGEDPNVNDLERHVAEIMGKEAGLFVSSGTQANLIALLCHCQRGDEYIAGQKAHNYHFEAGGAAVLGGIQPVPLINEPDGTLNLEKVTEAIKPDDVHHARTRLLSLENTFWGKVLSIEYMKSAHELARLNGLGIHLDGARFFNAMTALNVAPVDIARLFDTVSICLSKGLGAPVGSLLVGPSELIERGRRWRKMLGGGMRQAGVLAAAGRYALDHHVVRLHEDHENAEYLGKGLDKIEGIKTTGIHTNMAFITHAWDRPDFHQYLLDKGIKTSKTWPIRLVTHLDVSREEIDRVIRVVKDFKPE